jgi:hypothetical protein
MDVSQLLEDADVVVGPGTTSFPRQAAREPEVEPDTIFDVEVLDDQDAPAAAPAAAGFAEPAEDDFGSFFDQSQNFQGGGSQAQPLSPVSKPQKASETFMVPQENLEPAPLDDNPFAGDFSLDDDDGALSVDDTDMVDDVSDMLDDLDDD